MMNPRSLVVVFVLILFSATAAIGQSPLGTLYSESFSANGGMKIESTNDHLIWDGGSFTHFELKADQITIVTYTTKYQSVYPIVGLEPEETRETHSYDGPNRMTVQRTTLDSLIVTAPDAGHQTTVHHTGSATGAHVSERVIPWEQPHYETPGNYEFTIEDVVGLHLADQSHTAVEGDFTLYFWDVDLRHEHEGGVTNHKTGYWETTSEPTNTLREREWVQVQIFVTNGSLKTTTDPQGSALELFSNAMVSDIEGVVTYQNARGNIPTLNGLISARGSVATVEGGTAQWTPTEAMIQADFIDPAKEVTGTNLEIEREPTPFIATTSWLPIIVVGALLVVLTGGFLAPNIVHRNGPPQEGTHQGTWRQQRAGGYRVLANKALDKNKLPLAASMAGLAYKNDSNGYANADLLATIQSEMGKEEEALATRRRLHHVLYQEPLPDPDLVADNAYQAARIAARLERNEKTLHWLKIAISHEPDLADEARWEADFDEISQLTEFRILVGDRIDIGLNPPPTRTDNRP